MKALRSAEKNTFHARPLRQKLVNRFKVEN